ncbi:MAG: hypothetical protein CMJ78_15405 [Planctomycetaceae bacterium]|nr:hypothetical protein [Planctomycetaceae bacterium]
MIIPLFSALISVATDAADHQQFPQQDQASRDTHRLACGHSLRVIRSRRAALKVMRHGLR